MDKSGNLYAIGNTISTTWTNGAQDIVIIKFDSKYALTWGRYWGSTKTEVATGLSIEDSGSYVYVCGYSNSVPALSYQKNDMFIIKFSSDGTPTW